MFSQYRKFTGIAFAVFIGPSVASATTFGDSVFSDGAYAAPCTDDVLLSMSVVVSVPSRIHANAIAQYDSNSGVYYNGSFQVRLRDAGNTTTLALSNYQLFYVSQDPQAEQFKGLVTDMVLRVPSAPITPGTTAFVASPGTYLLQYVISPGGSCSGNGPYIWSASLTYILLSSTYDRIFADGFQATLGNGREQAMMV